MSISPATGLVDDYRPLPDHHDELVGPDGAVRPHWTPIAQRMAELGALELGARQIEAQRLLGDDRVTYNAVGDTFAGTRPWELDAIPVVVDPEDWRRLAEGIRQRAVLLDAVLTDLYGPRRLVSTGLVPPELVAAHPGFLRDAGGIRLPTARQLFMAGFDVGRDASGDHVVLADRTETPSGAGYALENRIVVSRVFPDLYRKSSVERLAPFFREFRTGLAAVAPETTDEPRIVVLTPGPWSPTAFEHAFLATYLGYPLVQGRDLRVRNGQVWMRTLGRPQPVHVILRRVTGPYCDPLELDPDSQLGVAGLMEACRGNTVSVVNTIGSGVLENAGLPAFLADAARALLGEDLLLPSVPTWWCGEETARSHVLAHLAELVIKPLTPTPRSRAIAGWELDAGARDELSRRIAAEPHGWVGQAPVTLAGVPTLQEGRLEARRSVLRAFAVTTGEDYAVMPGGLYRVVDEAGGSFIADRATARSKDTWVPALGPERMTDLWLDRPEGRAAAAATEPHPDTAMSSRAAENLFWLSRYAERAEDLVRLLRVTSDRLTEFATGPPGAAPSAGRECLTVLLRALTTTTRTWPGFVGDGAEERLAAPGLELRALLVDPDREGSVAHSIRRMLAAAGEVRDQLSHDTYLAIGHLDRDPAALDPHFPVAAGAGSLGQVMQALLAFAGLSAESMVRDAGWQFLEAGRRLERALQLCALLRSTIATERDPATDSLVLESVLTAAESIITYRRRYRSRAQVDTLLDLLLIDRTNPRGLLFQLERLEAATTAMPDPTDGDRLALDEAVAAALHTAHPVDTNALSRPDPTGSRAGLAAHLRAVTDALSRVGRAIEDAHFVRQPAQHPVFGLGLRPERESAP